jgi:hypothetical protein
MMNRAQYLAGGAHITARRGNDLPHAKLNPELVRQIRANRHGWTAKQWAQHLGLHQRTIDAVRDRRNWSHVQ